MRWDVIVRGGGIAGSAAALLLARRGFSVLLFEASKEARDKVCGEFLSPDALPLLAALDLLPALEAAGARTVRSAAVTALDGARWQIDLPTPGLGLSRRRLDALLQGAAAQAGASIRRGVSVQRLDGSPDGGFTAVGPRGEALARGRLALDAAGRNALPRPARNARARRMAGVKAHFRSAGPEDDAVELYAVPGGYCGVCAVEEQQLNVCLVIGDAMLREARTPDALLAAVCGSSPPLRRRLAGTTRIPERFVTTAALDYLPRPPAPGPVLRLGDAAGLVTPLTGDGMAMALRSADLAVPIVAACLRGEMSPERYAEAWARAWQREFGVRRRWGAGLQAVLTRPAAAGAALRFLAHAPGVGRFLFARTRGRVD